MLPSSLAVVLALLSSVCEHSTRDNIRDSVQPSMSALHSFCRRVAAARVALSCHHPSPHCVLCARACFASETPSASSAPPSSGPRLHPPSPLLHPPILAPAPCGFLANAPPVPSHVCFPAHVHPDPISSHSGSSPHPPDALQHPSSALLHPALAAPAPCVMHVKLLSCALFLSFVGICAVGKRLSMHLVQAKCAASFRGSCARGQSNRAISIAFKYVLPH